MNNNGINVEVKKNCKRLNTNNNKTLSFVQTYSYFRHIYPPHVCPNLLLFLHTVLFSFYELNLSFY